MKRTVFALAGMVLLSAFFGFASVETLSTPGGWTTALVRTVYTTAVLAVFFLLLPRWFGIPARIFLAMVSGAVAGWLFQRAGAASFAVDYLNLFGTVFILLLKLVVTPLIFVSILCGVSGIGDPRRLGSVGFKAIAYYLATTSIAILIGLLCVNAIRPGAGRQDLQVAATLNGPEAPRPDESGRTHPTPGRLLQDTVLPAIIDNPIMAGRDPLSIIFLAILLGASLASLGDRALPALETFRSLDQALIQLVLWIMQLAPIGVFTLMSKAIAELGVDYILSLAWYCLTVVTGLGLHFALLVGLLLPLAARVSPLRFLKGFAPAIALAFSTSSSSATLPVTIECTTRRIGADENVCNFMLPVGATLNMDGTALYQAVAVLFIAQVLGKDLSLAQQFGVFLTALMVSIGSAGIPAASIALMPLVLKQADIGAEAIGIVIGVDRFLDMCRSVVNITSDSVGALLVSRSEGAALQPQTGKE
ncbi:MAG: dicarboxylate/amino acid:cation symporter [Candidatus Hydrogenedentales bacterium]|jgi:proton glutamate symport protein